MTRIIASRIASIACLGLITLSTLVGCSDGATAPPPGAPGASVPGQQPGVEDPTTAPGATREAQKEGGDLKSLTPTGAPGSPR